MIGNFNLRLLFTLCAILPSAFTPAVTRAQQVNYSVYEPVFLIQQPTPNVCWATASTILKSWKSGTLLTIDAVVGSAGGAFPLLYQTDQGLGATDKASYLTALGLVAEPPATYSAQGIESKLRLWGPLWVTTAEPSGSRFSIHARVIIGIMGDGSGAGTTLTIVDPADGAKHLESFDTFTGKLESVAKSDYGTGADVRPLIVHY